MSRIMTISEEFNKYFRNIAEKIANKFKAPKKIINNKKQIINLKNLNPTDSVEINYRNQESQLPFLERSNNLLAQLYQ